LVPADDHAGARGLSGLLGRIDVDRVRIHIHLTVGSVSKQPRQSISERLFITCHP
jgi:hypothetical protein